MLLNEAERVKVRELVEDLHSIEIEYLTKREYARSIRANIQAYIQHLELVRSWTDLNGPMSDNAIEEDEML